MQARRLKRRRQARGTVTIEMLMAFMPLLLTFLGVTQLAHFRVAQLIVQHAATRGARAAMVILDDDPEHYDDAPRGDLTAGESQQSDSVLRSDNPLGQAKVLGMFSSNASNSNSASQEGARFAEIRAAAYHPLAILAPSPSLLSGALGVTGGAEVDSMMTSPWASLVFGLLVYNQGAAAITVHLGEESEPATLIAEKYAPVRVKVSYLLRCVVPLVSGLMCKSGRMLGLGLSGKASGDSDSSVRDRLEYVQSPKVRDLLLTLGGRYVLIEAEATLPNQGASYHQTGDGDET